MSNLHEIDRALSTKIVEGFWKCSLISVIIASFIFIFPYTTGHIYELFSMTICLALGGGAISLISKSSIRDKYIKYYVNTVLIMMILTLAIIFKNPEIFSMFYLIMAINMTYRDRLLHFTSSFLQVMAFLFTASIYPVLLPVDTAEDSTVSLMVTKVTIFFIVVFLVDIVNYYSLQVTEQLKRKDKEITMTALTDSVGALVQALEAKDQYTNGHSHRSSKYAGLIARKMNIENISEEFFVTGSLLHDIGKIGLPDSILDKNGPLTAAEFALIKEHPTIGAKILENTKTLKIAIPMVIHHHERYDGSGYPAGLKGENIPIEARILAVADSFDAMTSNRPYRSALSTSQAYQEIISNSEKQFCPKVVEAFVEVFNEIKNVYESYN